MKLRHILVDQKYSAEDILRKLDEGKTFEHLASIYSKCSSAKNGGDLGDVALSRVDEVFRECVETMKVGERSPIFGPRFGYHIAERYG